MLDKAKYSAFQSTLNSPIVSYVLVAYIMQINVERVVVVKEVVGYAVGYLRTAIASPGCKIIDEDLVYIHVILGLLACRH